MLVLVGAVVVALPTAYFVYFWYSRYSEANVPSVFSKYDSKFTPLVCSLPSLKRVYYPTWWCPFGFGQTLVRQLFRSKPSLPWKREVVDMPDGGCVATDWLEPENFDDSTPIVFFLPGITGSTHDCAYIIHAALEMQKEGYRCMVVNARGLGGVPLKTARTYNAANSEDFKCVVEMVTRRYPAAKKMACGFSLGGMILWNYLARSTAENAGILAALVVSSPFDNFVSTESLEKFWPRLLFNGHLAQCLKNVVIPYKHLFEDKLDWEKLMNVKTIREFDANFVVPMFGYDDWQHYYREATLRTKVDRICIPTIALNASDDCFAPSESLPVREVCAESENVAVVITRHGGHTSFMSHTDPNEKGLVEELLVDYTKLIFSQ